MLTIEMLVIMCCHVNSVEWPGHCNSNATDSCHLTSTVDCILLSKLNLALTRTSVQIMFSSGNISKKYSSNMTRLCAQLRLVTEAI